MSNKKLLTLIKREQEQYLFNLIMDGYVLCFGDYSISASNGEISNKDLILTTYYTKRGFNTVKGAMKHLEENS